MSIIDYKECLNACGSIMSYDVPGTWYTLYHFTTRDGARRPLKGVVLVLACFIFKREQHVARFKVCKQGTRVASKRQEDANPFGTYREEKK